MSSLLEKVIVGREFKDPLLVTDSIHQSGRSILFQCIKHASYVGFLVCVLKPVKLIVIACSESQVVVCLTEASEGLYKQHVLKEYFYLVAAFDKVRLPN
jgi:hypothetical protein